MAFARGPPTTRPNARSKPPLQKAPLTAADPATDNTPDLGKHRQATPPPQRASRTRGCRRRWPATATRARGHRRCHHGRSSRKATRPCQTTLKPEQAAAAATAPPELHRSHHLVVFLAAASAPATLSRPCRRAPTPAQICPLTHTSTASASKKHSSASPKPQPTAHDSGDRSRSSIEARRQATTSSRRRPATPGRLGLSRRPASSTARATARPSTATATHRYRAARAPPPMSCANSHQIRAKHPAVAILGAEPASDRPLRRRQGKGREDLRATAARGAGRRPCRPGGGDAGAFRLSPGPTYPLAYYFPLHQKHFDIIIIEKIAICEK
jgi:hypothetical protein